MPRLALSNVPTLRLGALAVCLSGLALSACAPKDQFPPACPQLSILSDAADVTRFTGAGRDVTDLSLDGRITAVPAQCKRGSGNTVETTLKVAASLARGPAATSRAAQVNYFVAITDGDRIVDESDYTFAVQFASNAERVGVIGDDIVLKIPVTREKSAAAYKIYVGFRLTPDELALNRKRGMR